MNCTIKFNLQKKSSLVLNQVSLTNPYFSQALTPVYTLGQPYTPFNFVANICYYFVFLTHSPATSLNADNNIDLNAIKVSLVYNEHSVPRCARL